MFDETTTYLNPRKVIRMPVERQTAPRSIVTVALPSVSCESSYCSAAIFLPLMTETCGLTQIEICLKTESEAAEVQHDHQGLLIRHDKLYTSNMTPFKQVVKCFRSLFTKPALGQRMLAGWNMPGHV